MRQAARADRLDALSHFERSWSNKHYLGRDGDRRWPLIAKNQTAMIRGTRKLPSDCFYAFWSALWLRSTPAFRWSNSLRAGFELAVHGAAKAFQQHDRRSHSSLP